MSKRIRSRFIVAHCLLIALIAIVIFVPNARKNVSPEFALLVTIASIELL
jgi:hypothetical protein